MHTAVHVCHYTVPACSAAHSLLLVLLPLKPIAAMANVGQRLLMAVLSHAWAHLLPLQQRCTLLLPQTCCIDVTY
jgi:hypothetical protein